MAQGHDNTAGTPKVGRPRKRDLAAQLGTKVSELPDGNVDADGLTARQRKILLAIAESMQTRGYPPSVREIAVQAGLASPSSVTYQLKELEAKGYLRRDAEKARAFQVNLPGSMTPKPTTPDPVPINVIEFPQSPLPNAVSVPIVGEIAAGAPIVAEQRIEDVYALPRQLVGEGTLFMLQVRGDSMIEAAICDGDFVVIRQQPTANNGDIVAALLDGEATVKTFKRVNNQVWLLPHNPAYDPIDGNEATILGKVVTVMRRV
ncbi:MAG: transcriptional repressor LexA [Propionibacteriaceae bacterium]|jgi:repressor LexA|nr:transcriptional repressor LexA [Propionibacteriaceae bacterium]